MGTYDNTERLRLLREAYPRTKTKNHIKQNQNHRNTNKTTGEIQRLEQGNEGGVNRNKGAETWRPIKGFRLTQVNQANYDQIQM